jgi:quercetin dioxygenase-like cupin family protein
MRNELLAGITVAILAAGAASPDSAAAQEPAQAVQDRGPDHHLTYLPADVAWRPGPASLAPGAEMAVLEGNPGEAGVFTMRLRLPDGFHIAPHWHPNVERVTVLSGTFHLGAGETADRAATTALGPGSYTSMPPGMRHYAYAEGETVIQLTSVGPWLIHYVDPAQDPRREGER